MKKESSSRKNSIMRLAKKAKATDNINVILGGELVRLQVQEISKKSPLVDMVLFEDKRLTGHHARLFVKLVIGMRYNKKKDK